LAGPGSLAQNRPVLSMRGHDVELFAGANMTYGGSSDSEVNDWTAMPHGAPSSIEVMTATPLPK